MDDKLKRDRLSDEALENVSGGSEIMQGTEEIRYGGADCPDCGSSDTEAHYQNGRITYIKCFECGLEKRYPQH